MNSRACIRLTTSASMASSCRPAREGCSFATASSRAGPASCALACNQHPGGARAKPPLRHYERSARMRYVRTASTAHCATLKDLTESGSGPKNRRVERREASVPRMRGLRELVCEGTQGAALWRLRAYVTGPRRGADAPRVPVGAPLPRGTRGDNLACLGGLMTRENDDACGFRRVGKAKRAHHVSRANAPPVRTHRQMVDTARRSAFAHPTIHAA